MAFSIVEINFDADNQLVDYQFIKANCSFVPQSGADLRGKWVIEYALDLEPLPCDLIVTPHPAASNLHERLAGKLALSSADACVSYAAVGRAKLDQRLADEARMPERR